MDLVIARPYGPDEGDAIILIDPLLLPNELDADQLYWCPDWDHALDFALTLLEARTPAEALDALAEAVHMNGTN